MPKIPATPFGNPLKIATQDEAEDHGEDVPEIVAPIFRQHSGKEDAKERAVGVAKNSEHDRDDPDVGMNDDEVGRGAGDKDHQDGKPDRRPADGAQALLIAGRRD